MLFSKKKKKKEFTLTGIIEDMLLVGCNNLLQFIVLDFIA